MICRYNKTKKQCICCWSLLWKKPSSGKLQPLWAQLRYGWNCCTTDMVQLWLFLCRYTATVAVLWLLIITISQESIIKPLRTAAATTTVHWQAWQQVELPSCTIFPLDRYLKATSPQLQQQQQPVITQYRVILTLAVTGLETEPATAEGGSTYAVTTNSSGLIHYTIFISWHNSAFS